MATLNTSRNGQRNDRATTLFQQMQRKGYGVYLIRIRVGYSNPDGSLVLEKVIVDGKATIDGSLHYVVMEPSRSGTIKTSLIHDPTYYEANAIRYDHNEPSVGVPFNDYCVKFMDLYEVTAGVERYVNIVAKPYENPRLGLFDDWVQNIIID